MRRLGMLVIVVVGLVAPARAAEDALDETLALVGLRRADLGWTPKGWWPRYPEVPYKLRAFDRLFAAPLETVVYTRVLGETAWEKLDPAGLDQDNGRGARALFEAVQRLGIDPKFGGFRGYTANCLAPDMPLDRAIVELYRAAGRTTRPNTFGMELPYPKIEEELAARAKVLPEEVSLILGQLVLNLVDAHRWVELAFRKVDARDRLTVATNYSVGIEMIDAYDYCPAMDDVARTWDEASMWYAAQKCVDALDLARIRLQRWRAERREVVDGIPPYDALAFAWETPWGWIRVQANPPWRARDESASPGPGDNRTRVDCTGTLLIVSLDGAELYEGPCASANVHYPLSLLLDLDGDDFYEAGSSPAQGCGLTGVGVLIDAGGNDCYRAPHYAQGVGQFGFGLLADLDGTDRYDLRNSGQGCGYFGIGLLFDVAGEDEYHIWADGQGFGGVGGVGVLADRTGNDQYVAERQHSVTGRPSYHSPDLDVAVSNVQGCGAGRRADGSDGHAWAGGLGALLDGAGDDHYFAGNWCMGTGYWFGIGLLHDRSGNDVYQGCVYSQGTGAHFCIGALVDEAGDDRHQAEENSRSSLAWAHDFTIAILLNAEGNDLYSVDTSGLAYSINRSVALVMDLGGDDTYRSDLARRQARNEGLWPGSAISSDLFRARGGVGTYFADTTSLALFLDVGGTDTYWGDLRNDTHWLDPPDAANRADRNYSVGVDRADGAVDFAPRPERPPSGPTVRPVAPR